MVLRIKQFVYKLLRRPEHYTKTDMVYLAKGGSWLTLGQGFSSLAYFGLSIAYANLLPKETFGTLKFVLSIISVLAIPTLVSMGTALTRSVSRGFEGSMIPALQAKIRWGLLSGLGGFVVAFYYYLQGDETLAVIFFITAFFLPFYNCTSVYYSLIQGRKRFDLITITAIIYNLIYIGGFILLMLMTDDIYLILLYNLVLPNLINGVFLWYLIKKLHPNKSVDPETVPYGRYLSFTGVITKIATSLDKILTWHYLGAAQVAVWTMALAPVNQIWGMLSNNIFSLAFPKLSQTPTETIKRTLPAKIFKFCLLTTPLIILYIVIAPYAFALVYPEYAESVRYSQLYALTILLAPISILGHSLIAKAQKREIIIVRTVNSGAKILALLLFVPFYGLMGIIIVEFLHSIFYSALVYYLFTRSKNE